MKSLKPKHIKKIDIYFNSEKNTMLDASLMLLKNHENLLTLNLFINVK